MSVVSEVRELLDKYHDWLRDRSTLRAINSNWAEITTPFLDRHNDYIQLYATRRDGVYQITDDGYTLSDLSQSGCNLETPKRQALLKTALNGFGVIERGGALIATAKTDNFPQRKHALIQAILAVNDLFYTASPIVKSLFKEDVSQWLDRAEVRYLPNVQFVGRSGFTNNFDFVIPRSRAAPERLLRAISNPSREAAQNMIFAWEDVRQVREADAWAIAVLNDQEKEVAGVIDALESYEIRSIPWSRRSESLHQVVS
jgi:hypothetical protein